MIDISNINIAIISGSLVLVGGVFVYLYFRRPFLDSLNLQVLLVKVKQKTDKEEKNNLIQEINVSEQLFNSLSSIKKPFVFETAVHHVGEGINFYLAVPRSHVDFAKRQVQGLFLEAQVEEAGEYTIFNAQSETVGAYLKMTENKIIPLRTYRESEVDTFSPILSTLSKLQENGDGAAIQLIVCPADKGAKKDITSALERLKKGEKFSDVVSDDSVWKILRELFFDKKKTEEDKPKPVDEEGVKSLQLKISKPLFKVNVRMVASSSTPGRAEEILLSMAASFSQFTAAMRNSFKIVKPRNLKKLIFAYVFREFNANEQCVLNSEELASIFHLPTFSTDVLEYLGFGQMRFPHRLICPTKVQ